MSFRESECRKSARNLKIPTAGNYQIAFPEFVLYFCVPKYQNLSLPLRIARKRYFELPIAAVFIRPVFI